MDLKTPRNVKLTAFYRRSFAFKTIRDRLPIILTKTIDGLSQKKDYIFKLYGNEATEEMKIIIGRLSKLKYEIQTNKPLKNIKSPLPDAEIYNACIKEREGLEGLPTPFHTIWLLVECYMYRKIFEAFEYSTYLKDYDPFRFSKQEQFQVAIPQIKETAQLLTKMSGGASKEDFSLLLQFNLWSNKCDLSMSPDGIQPIPGDQLAQLSDKILVNNSDKVWNALADSSNEVIDIVLDNAGTELLTDLCLAHYLTANGLVKKVNFHVKNFPWFVSDVTTPDMHWMLDQLCQQEFPLLKSFGEVWKKNFETSMWEIKRSCFWTLPVNFETMHKYDPDLYRHLSNSKLIIFKGDLNYRKLFRETFWDPETPVSVAQGAFGPAKLCSLRTCKSEIICGLRNGLADKCDKEDPLWMENGNYGVIQFSDKIVPLMNLEEIDKIIN